MPAPAPGKIQALPGESTEVAGSEMRRSTPSTGVTVRQYRPADVQLLHSSDKLTSSQNLIHHRYFAPIVPCCVIGTTGCLRAPRIAGYHDGKLRTEGAGTGHLLCQVSYRQPTMS